MLKKCRIFFLIVVFGQVNLANAGFRDLFRTLFINAPAAIAVSALTVGRWYLNNKQIAEMRRLKSQLDQSNQNLAETGLSHERAQAIMGLVQANQTTLNAGMLHHGAVLRSVQQGQAEINTTQAEILGMFRSIDASVEGVRRNLDGTQAAHTLVMQTQRDAQELLGRLKEDMQAEAVQDQERQQQINEKVAIITKNEAQLRKNLAEAFKVQDGLRAEAGVINTHLSDIAAKHAQLAQEQRELQEILRASRHADSVSAGLAGAGSAAGSTVARTAPPVTRDQLGETTGLLGLVFKKSQ